MLLDQMTGTWILVSTMLAATDPYNAQPGGMTPLVVGLAVTTVGLSYGSNAGGAINPARDFSPRCMAAVIFGYEAFRFVMQHKLCSINYKQYFQWVSKDCQYRIFLLDTIDWTTYWWDPW